MLDPAGFPTLAQDDMEEPIDLAAWLIEHPAASYVMRVSGHSMIDAGIADGDLVVVSRAVEARPGDIAAKLRPRTLFEGDTDKRGRLMSAIDAVNDWYGKFSAVPAAQGFKRDWRARSDSKSPAWTTRLAEMPVVNASRSRAE